MSGRFWKFGPMVVTGCTEVSEGCRECWSQKAHAMRCKNAAVSHIYSPDSVTDGKFNGKVQVNLHLLERAIKKAKPGDTICRWNDLYHEGVSLADLVEAHCMMDAAKHLTFLIITKRIHRAAEFCSGVASMGFTNTVPDHMWHIVTCENQARADERIPHLLRIPGKRGVIIEPMLGPVNLMKCQAPENHCKGSEICNTPLQCDFHPLDRVHQVILGGETGQAARPMHPEWARDVRDQCAAAGVPFFFKAQGEWDAQERPETEVEMGLLNNNQCVAKGIHGGHTVYTRIGAKKAGRLLDGREHNELAWRTK